MGRTGLRELAARNVELAHDAAVTLTAAGLPVRFSGAFFNEFVISVPHPRDSIDRAAERGVIAGVALDRDYPELPDGLLVTVTELNRPVDCDRLRDALTAQPEKKSAERS
jgi:glycine dehydrogenase subunit 1